MPKRSSNVARRSFKRKRTSTTKRKPTKRVKRSTRKRSATKRSIFSKPRKVGTSAWISHGGTIRAGKKPFIHKLTKILADKTYLENVGSSINALVGKQVPVLLSEEYSENDIASQLAGAAYRTILRSCVSRTLLTNATNETMFITLYDYVARRDSNVAKTIVDYWKDNKATSAATTDVNIIGTSPFNSDLLTTFHKILKVTKIYLGAGESCEHIKSFRPNRLYDGSLQGYTIGAGQTFKGLTCGTLAVVHGQPVGDSGTSNVTTGGGGGTDGDVYYVNAKTYRFSPLQDNSHSIDVSGNTLVTSVTNEQIMETDGDGANHAVQAT